MSEYLAKDPDGSSAMLLEKGTKPGPRTAELRPAPHVFDADARHESPVNTATYWVCGCFSRVDDAGVEPAGVPQCPALVGPEDDAAVQAVHLFEPSGSVRYY